MRALVGTGFAVAVVVASAVVESGAASGAAGVATVGHRAPAFLVENLAGDDVSSKAFAGKPLVLNVFASWCPPCRGELPRIAEAARAARGRIVFVGIDEQEASGIAARFAREMRLPYAVELDHGQFAASYGAASLPETVFVDARGIVRAIQHGAIDSDDLQRDLAIIAPAVMTGAR